MQLGAKRAGVSGHGPKQGKCLWTIDVHSDSRLGELPQGASQVDGLEGQGIFWSAVMIVHFEPYP